MMSVVTRDEARESLAFHVSAEGDGFLGSLRPYRGLRESNFHEVMAALRCIAPDLQGDLVDRSVLRDLWGICHMGRAWGVHPDGMLRRNQLITDADVARLEHWIECISYATFMLMEGPGDETEALSEYLREFPKPP